MVDTQDSKSRVEEFGSMSYKNLKKNIGVLGGPITLFL